MATIPVRVVTVQRRSTVVISQTTTWQEFPTLWPQLLDGVYRVVRDNNRNLANGHETEAWRNVMLYKDERPTVEVGVLAPASLHPDGRVVASHLPEGTAALAIHRGDYARLGATHTAVREYVQAQGLRLAGPRWEIYGHWRAEPTELETEIYYLLR